MIASRRSKLTRGLKTGWLQSGNDSGPILLLLHGYPDGPEIWEEQASHFENRFQVLRPALRGVGDSEPGALHRYQSETLALDLLEVLGEIDPGKKRQICVVGHDLGAAVAWAIAPLLGNRLSSLVIINGMSVAQFARRFFNPAQQLRSWYMYVMQTPLIPEILTRIFPAPLQTFAYATGGLSRQKRPQSQNYTQEIQGPISVYRAYARELAAQPFSKPTKLERPVLILWGKDDAFVIPPAVKEIEPFAKDFTIRIVPGNHWVFRERPQEINSLIDDFFGRFGL